MEAPSMKEFDAAIGGDGKGSGVNIINSTKFIKNYENLKISIMKRVKNGIKRNKRESTMKGSHANEDGFEFPLNNLVSENELFDGI